MVFFEVFFNRKFYLFRQCFDLRMETSKIIIWINFFNCSGMKLTQLLKTCVFFQNFCLIIVALLLYHFLTFQVTFFSLLLIFVWSQLLSLQIKVSCSSRSDCSRRNHKDLIGDWWMLLSRTVEVECSNYKLVGWFCTHKQKWSRLQPLNYITLLVVCRFIFPAEYKFFVHALHERRNAEWMSWRLWKVFKR